MEKDLRETILDEFKGSVQVSAGDAGTDQTADAQTSRKGDWDDDHDDRDD